jgi:hypothetical protein
MVRKSKTLLNLLDSGNIDSESKTSEMSIGEIINHRFTVRFAEAEGPDAKIEAWLTELDNSEGQTKKLKEILPVYLNEI